MFDTSPPKKTWWISWIPPFLTSFSLRQNHLRSPPRGVWAAGREPSLSVPPSKDPRGRSPVTTNQDSAISRIGNPYIIIHLWLWTWVRGGRPKIYSPTWMVEFLWVFMWVNIRTIVPWICQKNNFWNKFGDTTSASAENFLQILENSLLTTGEGRKGKKLWMLLPFLTWDVVARFFHLFTVPLVN